MSKDHMTQSQIDRLINSSLGEQSIAKPNIPQTNNKQNQDSNQYDDQFQDYEQSRRTAGFTKSRNFQESKKYKKEVKLIQIKQQPQKNIKSKKENEHQQYIPPPNPKKVHTLNMDTKDNLPYNYARLQERERELLLTTLAQDNKHLKIQLQKKQKQCNVIHAKYNELLTSKTVNVSSVRESQLQKELSYVKRKLQKVQSLQKVSEQRNKYKTSMKKTDMKFIPQEQSNKRQSLLLQMIQKLKVRLVQSDEDMKVLQNKLNEGLQHNDELVRKMRRVQKLQYQIQKFTDQAQTDRMFIQTLKQKVKDAERVATSQKNERIKLQAQIKRLELGQLNHSDIMKQLRETRDEKQRLQKSIKDLSSNFMSKVVNSFKKKQDEVLDEEDILKL